MKRAFLVFLLMVIGPAADAATPPRFHLSAGDSKGVLVWRSHTFVQYGDQLVPKGDFVVEHPDVRMISVCLEWKTEPAPSTGEFLTAFGAWTIPSTILQKDAYILSVERQASQSIVFTLSTLKGRLLLKSEAFPIATGWQGPAEDIGKHISPVPSSALDEKEPNQPPQHNAGSRPSSDDSSASETLSSLGPRG